MRPVRALSYFATFLVLLAYYWMYGRQAEVISGETVPAPVRWLDVAAVNVVGVVLRTESAELVVRRSDGRWSVAGPLRQSVPPDLVPSLLDGLLGTAPVELLGPVGVERLTEFGLERDTRVIELETEDGQRVSVRLGGSNPARTAVYAVRAGSDDVALLGLNVDYYFTLGIGSAAGGSNP